MNKKTVTTLIKIVLWLVMIGIVITGVLYLAGCARAEPQIYSSKIEDEDDYEITKFDGLSGVIRFVDREYDIVCYTLYSDGIHCLPIP